MSSVASVPFSCTMAALDLDRHIRSISKGELLAEQQVKVLCESVKDVLRAVSNIKQIEAPVSVVSNIHGYSCINLPPCMNRAVCETAVCVFNTIINTSLHGPHLLSFASRGILIAIDIFTIFWKFFALVGPRQT